METWEVSPHQRAAARHMGSARAHAREATGNSAHRGCGQRARGKSTQRRARARQYRGKPGLSPLQPAADSQQQGARERVGDPP
eukprot:4888220-Prymnesium_polylepis.1